MNPRITTRPACTVLALLTGGWVSACGISPKPEPPEPLPVIESDVVQVTPARDYGEPAGVEGGPGSVRPAQGVVRVWNLDAQTDPIDAPVGSDGSFAAHFDLMLGDEVRLQVIDGDRRSVPVDLVVTDATGPAQRAEHALQACLTLDPALEVVYPASASVLVHNGCDADVVLDPPWYRRAAYGLGAGQSETWPATIPSGAALVVTVDVQPDAGAFEEILFLRASAPKVDRRPLTVRGSSR